MGKIVYILGAGFSVPNEIPQQNLLIEKAFEKDPGFYQDMRKFYEAFYLPTQRVTPKAISKVSLEDIFSLLDRSIKSAHRYRGFTVTDFIELQNKLLSKLAILLGTYEPNSYVMKFAQKIIDKRMALGHDSDQISIISLNWDNLLDYAITKLSRSYNRFGKNVAIDYCMYDYSFKKQFYPSLHYVPSIFRKRDGAYNIKLIKLHGSVNWNICQACQKVYVENRFIDYSNLVPPYKFICNSCKVNLEYFMISPTFMKDFQANHIKNIWHNAFIDLQEATKIIFIGYSFPLADFEFKIMLSQAIRRENIERDNIRVIDYSKTNPEGSRERSSKAYTELKERYSSFFGRNVRFYNEGVVKYIYDEMDKDLDEIH